MRRIILLCFGMLLLSSGCVTAIPSKYRMVEASPAISYDDAWIAVVDSIGERLEIEMVDKDSGYLRTGWKGHSRFLTSYRTRCVARVTSRNPFKIKIKVELQEYDEFRECWVPRGNDTMLENEILTDIRGRLQRR